MKPTMDLDQLLAGLFVIDAISASSRGDNECALDLCKQMAEADPARSLLIAVELASSFLGWAATATNTTAADLLRDLRGAAAE